MPDIPLLGSLKHFSFSSGIDRALLISGPLFTANKLNLNGWGVPESEADDFASTFSGMPIRWCPHGKTIVDSEGEVTPGEHYCDAIDDQKSIVGHIDQVYASGKDLQGRTVYSFRGKVTNPKTIKGIEEGEIPSNVSLYAYAKDMSESGMMLDCRGTSVSIVTEPAYLEAQFQWQAISASFVKPKRKFMADELKQTNLAGEIVTPPTGNVTINIAASKAAKESDGEDGTGNNNAVCAKCAAPVPAYAKFCPGCGASMHASCPGCGATVHPAAKFCESCGTAIGQTVGDNSVAAAVQKGVEEELEKIKRKDLAASIVAAQVKIGTLAEADKDKRAETLIAMPAATLETLLDDFCKVADRIGRPMEKGMQSGQIPAAASAQKAAVPDVAMPSGQLLDGILQRFGIPAIPMGAGKASTPEPMTLELIAKYGKLGGWEGEYHRQNQRIVI